MNKKALVVVVAMLALGAGAVGYALLISKDSRPQPNTTTTTETQVNVSGSGSYVDYKDGIIAQTKGTKILFFYAEWCPQCRQLQASIREKGLPEGVTVFKVNYDNSQDLRQKYGVTIQTTLVKVDDSGNLVKKFVAYEEPSVEALKQNLL